MTELSPREAKIVKVRCLLDQDKAAIDAAARTLAGVNDVSDLAVADAVWIVTDLIEARRKQNTECRELLGTITGRRNPHMDTTTAADLARLELGLQARKIAEWMASPPPPPLPGWVAGLMAARRKPQDDDGFLAYWTRGPQPPAPRRPLGIF